VINAKIAIASLSYDPATDLEMYPGTIEIKRAEINPASDLPTTSFAKKYIEIEVNPAKTGAKKTHTFLISIGNKRVFNIQCNPAEVNINPG
jgi:hypothetical protein